MDTRLHPPSDILFVTCAFVHDATRVAAEIARARKPFLPRQRGQRMHGDELAPVSLDTTLSTRTEKEWPS